MPDPKDIVITRLGAKGDGAAEADGRPVFVPYALPGEIWRRENETWQRVRDSDERVAPICPHFEDCGGCVAQHMSEKLYRDWKLDAVRQAFSQHDLDVDPVLSELFDVASRRRCALTAKRTKSGVLLGFLAAKSHDIVDMQTCSVLLPAITGKLDALRAIAERCGEVGDTMRFNVLAASQGLEVSVSGDTRALSQEMRVDLAKLASASGLARLIVNGDDILQLHVPTIMSSGVEVAVHPNAFLQAVEAAEIELATLVMQYVGRAKLVSDLFCGLGTFAFALARQAKVVALDSDRASIETLCAARDRAQNLKPIDARVRDLFREPLSRKELESFDCVVFDPPRAGAEGQAKMLAKSSVAKVVAVSCNPSTLARDVRHLVDGGYQLDALHCVDQFRFTAHIECVAALSRPRQRRPRRR